MSRASICTGDTMTISGIYRNKPNPAWRWWAFWRPRLVPSGELQSFVVVGTSGTLTIGDECNG